MRKLVVTILLLNLVGCASYWDNQDPCQTRNRPQGYQKPNFCGASANRQYIYSPGGSQMGYIVTK